MADDNNFVLKEISKKSVFRLKIVELQHNYSGHYCCNASSVAGSSRLCTQVTVVCKYRVESLLQYVLCLLKEFVCMQRPIRDS